jgi:hypothetical protein
VLDRRVEITGMRADGSEFPVELTTTRIDVAPTFIGYVGDITERKLQEAELKALRARMVQAADEARRRPERDLHTAPSSGSSGSLSTCAGPARA